MQMKRAERTAFGRVWKRIATRGVLLVVGGLSLYLLAPSLVAVFASWRRLVALSPAWLGGMVLLEAASFVSLWELERIALRTRSWFAIGTSQLAGNAFGRVCVVRRIGGIDLDRTVPSQKGGERLVDERRICQRRTRLPRPLQELLVDSGAYSHSRHATIIP